MWINPYHNVRDEEYRPLTYKLGTRMGHISKPAVQKGLNTLEENVNKVVDGLSKMGETVKKQMSGLEAVLAASRKGHDEK